MPVVLFLCTGNYYRSRYAELLFNELIRQTEHNKDESPVWRAESRALALALGVNNVGPISPLLAESLERHGIRLEDPVRFPLQASVADFLQADLIVALQEREHKPLILERFPQWSDRVEYWSIPDVGGEYGGLEPSKALAQIEANVRLLIQELSQQVERDELHP